MKSLEADIVVIGAGAAGLAATVAAAEKGANVITFEKAATTGGCGNMAGGLFATESRLQRIKQVALTSEQAFKIHMDFTHWQVDARLVKAYYDKSGSTIDWLEKMGIEFIEPAAYFPGSQFTWHTIKSSDKSITHSGSASIMMKILTEKAKSLGVNILLKTTVRKIQKKDNCIAGIIAEDRSGGEIQVKAKAIIIATGGFGDNPEWIKKYLGYSWGEDLFSFRIHGLLGDGIRMAWEAGAGNAKMIMDTMFVPPKFERLGDLGIMARQPSLVINDCGERFFNEEIMSNNSFTSNAIISQRNRCAFNILDEGMVHHFGKFGWDYLPPAYPNVNPKNLRDDLERALASAYSYLFIANSVEELADKIGVNPTTLRKTVDEYNNACESGNDRLFFKNNKYLRSIKQPRFMAFKLYSGGFGTLGGVKINHNTEVLTENFDVIPGLYAVGNDANSLYADSYPFLLPGNTMGFAINSGRIGGENAAEYVKRLMRSS